jgi:hypothetical protein
MGALLKFLFDSLEIELGKLFIISMTVNTGILTFHSELPGMRKRIIFRSMTVGTGKAFVIGSVKFLSLNHPVVAHHSRYGLLADFVNIGILGTAVASETFLILLEKLRNNLLLFDGCILNSTNYIRYKHQIYKHQQARNQPPLPPGKNSHKEHIN